MHSQSNTRRIMKYMFLTLAAATLISCGRQNTSTSDEKIIFPAEGIASTEYNTGKVLFSIMKDSGNTMITNFVFTSGSRTFWHYHPSEQSLLVLDGEGYYQEEGKPKQYIKQGDVIVTPANVRHWNGATANSVLECITVTEHSIDGHAVQLRAVTDEEYAE